MVPGVSDMAAFRRVANATRARLVHLLGRLPDPSVYNDMHDAAETNIDGDDDDRDYDEDDDNASDSDVDDDVVMLANTDDEEEEETKQHRNTIPVTRVRNDLERTVAFLTAGQRCWDWFSMRTGHVTGSAASRIGAFGRVVAGLGADSDDLMRRFEKEFKKTTDSWYGTHRSTLYMRTGIENEPRVMAWLEKEQCVVQRFEVGMAENKRHPWLGCSPDAIAVINMPKVPVEGLDCRDEEAVAPVEVNTFYTATSIARHERVAATCREHKWVLCDAADAAAFKACVPTRSHRCQLLHHAAVFEKEWVLYVAATEAGVLYHALVRVPAAVRRAHVDWLAAATKPLFWWTFTESGKAPAYVPLAQAELVESHHRVWWAMRKYVLTNGPFPPVHQLRFALVLLYNKTMGAAGTL